MTLRLIRLPKATADTEQIWLSIADDNLPAAERWLARLYEAQYRLTDFPTLGRMREELANGLRS